jgi:glucose-6-phosphate isomerase/transaldolase/glucose-6-phosphate isomerase
MSRTKATIETANVDRLAPEIEKSLALLTREKVIPRIWEKDWTVWGDGPAEIVDRLGWLTSPWDSARDFRSIRHFVRRMRNKGYRRALLLGMGGSSLAPLVLGSAFRTPAGFLDLDILDSTDPGAVMAAHSRHDPAKTLFIVASKSGTTAETSSFFNFFWSRAAASLGEKGAAEHFVAITDPGTPLEDLARRLGFPSFAGDPEIGGRFSAISSFDLVPAALKGIRIERIAVSARKMADRCRESAELEANPGAYLGAVLAAFAAAGQDKATFLLPTRHWALGLWLEQLIAESTGKKGKGILPIVGEAVGPPGTYGADRLFIHIREEGGTALRAAAARLKSAGFPILAIAQPSSSGIGAQFFLWEFATAIAGHLLGINPFDQPDVESAKKKAREMLRAFRETGSLPQRPPAVRERGLAVYSDIPAPSAKECLRAFLAVAKPGDYLALQAFLPPGRSLDSALEELRLRLRGLTRLATTVGYGPRYLHSTGQLHKGDRGNGLFIQLTAADRTDLPIPDKPGGAVSSVTFGLLKAAQAAGDFAALASAGRRIIRFHFEAEATAGVRSLVRLLPRSV